MAKVIGIDLGTTNSCVSVMEGDQAKVIENSKTWYSNSSPPLEYREYWILSFLVTALERNLSLTWSFFLYTEI